VLILLIRSKLALLVFHITAPTYIDVPTTLLITYQVQAEIHGI